MKRLFSAKPLVAAAIALGALAAGTAAHARSDVIVSIGLNGPYGHVQPAPVYVQPQPVYVQPRTVYTQPHTVYAQPQTVYTQPQTVIYGNDERRGRFDNQWDNRRQDRRHDRGGPFGDWDRDGVQNRFDRDSHFYDHRAARRHAAWADADRDGVPNRFDPAPHNPYRR